ncbi:hypothetical protein [Brachybacterium kimchii]|uniref:DUF222 domain-containing protein n=1 Tax=Brachybacterium kimchii TaxID=2942909 RepID=A0ABY4NB63_9MICO|nr:hypothetical protein [Brachybacterium kimchii]UQN30620.1 hypothetical protein M4486_04765 [Brachybacterium kimchii]
MPAIRSTRPNLNEQLPVALAARVAGTDRASLAHLIDHGLVPGLDIDSVRALAASGEVTAKATDDPGFLVARLDIDPMARRITDMSESQLEQALEGPHRIPGSYLGRELLVAVRSFVIATGRIDALADLVALRTDRRGREIYARTITVRLERRLTDLTSRPPKADGDSRWLGRRARMGTGGAVLALES